MSANINPIFKSGVSSGGATFAAADTTTKKDLLVGTTEGAEGALVEAIYITSNDTAAINLMFYYFDGTTDFFIGNVNIPAGSGYTTVARVEALRTLAPDLGFLTVKAGHKLKCSCLATMTAAKVCDVVWQGGPY